MQRLIISRHSIESREFCSGSGATRKRILTAKVQQSACNVLSVRLPDNVDGAISLLRRISHANAIRTAPVNALALPPSYRGSSLQRSKLTQLCVGGHFAAYDGHATTWRKRANFDGECGITNSSNDLNNGKRQIYSVMQSTRWIYILSRKQISPALSKT